eukprot:NODE_4691_length_753_cov_98.857827_g4531_i0.p1 GENE.NODE_4691_length_753_cov_98.857827_g4531_i0~~NODE_4691_length_753_cov_98.857827_g4531_i0.p1  ORF type:complete len:207 (+),score=43.61 NODE_4691_length_753_cov_98.857827_g4531_i0:45-665(+)
MSVIPNDDEWSTTTVIDGNDARGDKIPLQRCWTFWFFKNLTGSDEAEWSNKQLQRLDDFDTIQDFWGCYNALPSPVTLGHKQCFHMMKNAAKPEWDDECNRRGGIWSFRTDKAIGDDVWQTLLLAVIGEQFACVLPRTDDICGLTVKGGPPSSNQLIFQVWNKEEASRGVVLDKLRNVLGRLTRLDTSSYKCNSEEIRKAQDKEKA